MLTPDRRSDPSAPRHPTVRPAAAVAALLVALATGGAPSAAGAQPPTGAPTAGAPPAGPPVPPRAALTLDAVLRRLEATSPRVATADAAAAAASARVPGARTLPDPRVQLGTMNRDLPSLRPMETMGMDQLQIMQMLPLGGKLASAGRAAGARAAAAGGRAAAQRWEVRAEAAMAFHDLYAADRALAVMRATQGLLRESAGAAAAMYRVGSGRQADVLRAQLEVSRMGEEILTMAAMRRRMAARLGALLDVAIDPDTLAVAAPPLPDALPGVEALVALALGGRPMLAAGRQEALAAAADERLARRELLPDLELGVQLARRPASAAPPALEPGMAGRADWMASLMVGASLPIFARQRQLRMREEAAAMRRMADADVRAMAAETRGRVTEAAVELERARTLRRLYRATLIPQAEAARDASAAAYRTGGVDFMTLVDSHMTVNRLRQELPALRAAEGKAVAELEMLVGRALVDPARPVAADAEAER